MPVLLALFVSAPATAEVDPACADLPKPDDYDEQVQQDFLANYVALGSTFSAVHAPIPHATGRAAVGVHLGGLPPLSCRRRYVLDWTKTEDTNKSPVVPRLHATVLLPEIGPVVPSLDLGYLPPVPLLGTRNVILSGAIGAAGRLGEGWQLGGRFHTTVHRTIADIATPFDPSEEGSLDLYLATTLGIDLTAGVELGAVTPYVAVGFTDVSTFFWIGEDGVVTDNVHPYAGPTASLGVDGLVADVVRLGAEVYTAPGGSVSLDPERTVDGPFGRYGRIVTVRLRLGWEIGSGD